MTCISSRLGLTKPNKSAKLYIRMRVYGGTTMQNELLSIGKMAEMNHLTVATLRLYDELGLLHPRRRDPESGYRYYDITQNARLDMIAYMKELGMSLAEIADILEKEDITLVETILIRKNEQLHRQMRELRARHNAVERAIASVERYRKSPTKGTIALEYIDRRYLWGLPCRDNFYDTDIYAYERELMHLRQSLMERGFSHIHSYATGTSISKENFLAGRFEAKDVFVFLDYRDVEHFRDSAVLDSGMYACIYLDRYDDEIGYASRLLEACRSNRWQIGGDYICEVLTEFNVFDSNRRNMFLRLQVPVTFDNR